MSVNGNGECKGGGDQMNSGCGCASQNSEKKAVEFKVKFVYKFAFFVGAVLALSWFFEGWRQVQEGFTLPHCAMLLFGTATTIFFVGVQAYWIYLEEKFKGTLKKRFGLFERIYEMTRRDSDIQGCR